MRHLKVFVILLTLSFRAQAYVRGDIAFESQFYKDDKNTQTVDNLCSLKGEVEFSNSFMGIDYKASFLGRGYRDDDGNSYFYGKDLYLEKSFNNIVVTVGQKVFNWSATEIFHPADVVNAPNFDSNFERFEKAGEVMASLSYQTDLFSALLFYSPYVIASNFPYRGDRKNYLSSNIQIGNSYYLKSDGSVTSSKYHNQIGLAFDFVFESINSDVKLFYLNHYDRYKYGYYPSSSELYIPVYYRVQRFGLKSEASIGSFMFKIEGSYNDYLNKEFSGVLQEIPDNYVVAFGVDYGVSFVNGSEMTWFLEHQRIFGTTIAERASLDFFQNDIMVGQRYSLNDEDSKELVLFFIYDLERKHEFIFDLVARMRVWDDYIIELRGRYIDAPVKSNSATNLEHYDRDHQIAITLTRHF